MSDDNKTGETTAKTTTNTNEGFKVVGDKPRDVETFEDLIEYATELKMAVAGVKDLVNSLPTKVRNVQRDVKAREREFESARDAIKKLQKVSGF